MPKSEPLFYTAAILYTAVAIVLHGCSASQEPPPCDPASYAHLSATCGDDEDICLARIEERERFCAAKIRSGR